MEQKAGLGARGGTESMEIGGQIVLTGERNKAKIEDAERVI